MIIHLVNVNVFFVILIIYGVLLLFWLLYRYLQKPPDWDQTKFEEVRNRVKVFEGEGYTYKNLKYAYWFKTPDPTKESHRRSLEENYYHFTVEKDGVEFSCRREGNIWVIEFVAILRKPHDPSSKVDLQISRRGQFSKMMAINQGEYHHIHSDFNITSSNMMLTKYILTDPEMQQLLYGIPSLTNNNFILRATFSNIIRLGNDIELIIEVLNRYTKLISSIRLETGQIKRGYDIEDLMIENDIEFMDLICVICYRR